MRKLILIIFLTTLLCGCGTSVSIPEANKAVLEQTNEEKTLMEKGIAFHDSGEFDKAISIYSEIITNNPENVFAYYEIAFTSYMKKDFEECIEYTLKGLEFDSDFRYRLLVLLGNTLDVLGRTEEAIKIYREGILLQPDDFMLYYNLGVAYYGQKDYDNARFSFTNGIRKNPYHASGNLGLGNLLMDTNSQIPAALMMIRYLTLEPNTDRSPIAFSSLEDLLNLGVEIAGENKININIFDRDESDGYFNIKMTLKLQAAILVAQIGKEITPVQARVKSIITLFDSVAEQEEGKQKDFVANYMFPYVREVVKKDYSEVLAYYIIQSVNNPEVDKWLENNKEKVDAFLEWNNNYNWIL